ncbi:hypothetical protein JCM4814A_04390 [Streptomyces phaeofaciens JCM 4814]|uniref:Uncharacterized protein n=1 Tax=Streptomyces phaeofaciens TaxID=68254 RepID=A0A918LVG0_9ACTN|nr:hypothetical protein GCM10010226_36120 [Streptomyces phaeofaciens]
MDGPGPMTVKPDMSLVSRASAGPSRAAGSDLVLQALDGGESGDQRAELGGLQECQVHVLPVPAVVHGGTRGRRLY